MYNNSIITRVIERKLGFDKYRTIMESVKTVDVSKNISFQTAFNDYYEIRRNAEWRDGYYQIFQKVKHDENITFDEIIDHLYKELKTNQGSEHPVEASFSSKMLATINPEMPILDSQVLTNMGLSIKGKNPEEKLVCAKTVYAEICRRYRNYIGTKNCNNAILLFNRYFPDCLTMSDVRKIDWYLWAFTKVELIEIGLFGALL